jgi:hypothetical protein
LELALCEACDASIFVGFTLVYDYNGCMATSGNAKILGNSGNTPRFEAIFWTVADKIRHMDASE